jgi:pantetheine-phosphate adenylyltransferase
MLRIAYYPGSFDIVTLGHMYVIETAAQRFDRLIVAVSKNSGKDPMFDVDTRLRMLDMAIEEYRLPNIESVVAEGLSARVALEYGAGTIVRGIRLISDFEGELNYALNCKKIVPEIDVIWIPPKQEYIHISSTIVKDIIRYGKFESLREYVPRSVALAIEQRKQD